MSSPCASICSAVVLRLAKTSIETPASPTKGEIFCTEVCSARLNLWPEIILLWISGFFAIRLGFVVWPSTNPIRDLILRVSSGSPPSTRIFVFGFLVSIALTATHFHAIWCETGGTRRPSDLSHLRKGWGSQ